MSNVQKGDTAMMTDAANYGRLVHVDSQHAKFSSITHKIVWQCTALQRVRCGWVYGGHFGEQAPGTTVCAYDHQLRPIRDNDGTDETVLKAGLPKANYLAPKRQLEFSR